MWNASIAHYFHLKRTDMVDQNISLQEYLAMIDWMRG